MATYYKYRNILLKPYQAIYYFLPKVACSSFKAYLADALEMEKDPIYPDSMLIHEKRLYPFPFSMPEELHDKYAHYFKFAFVRNPWSRLLSCYKSKIRPKEFNNIYFKNGLPIGLRFKKNLFWGGMSFHEFVDSVCNIPDWEADTHYQSQYYQLTDPSGSFYVDFIGKLENLRKDFVFIQEYVHLPRIALAHLNQSHNEAYQAYYNNELREKVAIRFAVDIEVFQYSFGEKKHSSIHFLKDKHDWNLPQETYKKYLIFKARNLELQKMMESYKQLKNEYNGLRMKIEQEREKEICMRRKLLELKAQLEEMQAEYKHMYQAEDKNYKLPFL
jgi:hypothetical protein